MLQSGAEVEHKRAARWWLVLHQYLELEDALETEQSAPRALIARPTSKGIPEGQFFARGTAMGMYFFVAGLLVEARRDHCHGGASSKKLTLRYSLGSGTCS